jgi:hypothetical protein
LQFSADMIRSNMALSLLSSTLVASYIIGNNNVLSSATSCYPAYNPRGSYANGDWVSSASSSSVEDVLFGRRGRIIQDEDIIVCSPPGVGDCPESGLKERGEVGLFHDIAEVYNYQCISDDLCSNNEVEAPGSINSGHVWAAESDPCTSSVSIV